MEKVTIPNFVAEFIQDNKKNSVSDIFSQDWLYESVNEKDDAVNKWLYDNDTAENDRRYFIAVQAFVTGEYEVEKEKLYRVVLNEIESGEIGRGQFTKHVLFLDKNGYVDDAMDKGFIAQLTENEIKAIDPRFMAFAEEVK